MRYRRRVTGLLPGVNSGHDPLNWQVTFISEGVLSLPGKDEAARDYSPVQ